MQNKVFSLTKAHCTHTAHNLLWPTSPLLCLLCKCFQVVAGMYGGEGGIRTPGTNEGTSDFESGAFNRALPPLRIVTYLLSAIYDQTCFIPWVPRQLCNRPQIYSTYYKSTCKGRALAMPSLVLRSSPSALGGIPMILGLNRRFEQT
jgi:hypothetical protein